MSPRHSAVTSIPIGSAREESIVKALSSGMGPRYSRSAMPSSASSVKTEDRLSSDEPESTCAQKGDRRASSKTLSMPGESPGLEAKSSGARWKSSRATRMRFPICSAATEGAESTDISSKGKSRPPSCDSTLMARSDSRRSGLPARKVNSSPSGRPGLSMNDGSAKASI